MNDFEHSTDGPDNYDDENLPYASQDDSSAWETDVSLEHSIDEQVEYPQEDEANGQHDTTLKDPIPQPAEPDPIAHLPLALTLRCGQLNLSLSQLRHLGTGTVLVANGVAPGFATLCHGDRVVAEGELVDVDGRLGLQITRTAALP